MSEWMPKGARFTALTAVPTPPKEAKRKPDPFPNQVNSCERKRRYPDEVSAMAHALHSMSNSGTDALRTYKCPVCSGWHLTKRMAEGDTAIIASDAEESEDGTSDSPKKKGPHMSLPQYFMNIASACLSEDQFKQILRAARKQKRADES